MCEHNLKRNTGGEGPMRWLQPSCSCGWIGNKHHAYEDYQHTLVKEQEANHINETRLASA